MSLEGKIVLVTGASRGIGQAIALTLGGAGATGQTHHRVHRAAVYRLRPPGRRETATANARTPWKEPQLGHQGVGRRQEGEVQAAHAARDARHNSGTEEHPEEQLRTCASGE